MKSHPFLPPGLLTIFILGFYLASCTVKAQTTPIATATNPSAPASGAVSGEPAATTTAAGTHPLVLVWESEFSPDGAIASPSDMVVDDKGNVYVSSQSTKNIKVFDSEGNFVTHWGGFGTGDGKFNLSSGIALDADGNVYVVDFNNARIQKFDSTGKFLLQWPTRATPASIGIDQQGHVYVDIFFHNDQHIQKFDSSGNLISEWGSPGSENGQFGSGAGSGPEDVAIDQDGYIYIADRVNHRIQKFDSEGNFLAAFGGDESRDGFGLFYDPRGIAVDEQGNMYVLDSYFLQKLDPKGGFIAQWATTEGGDLDRAAIVFVDGHGYLYVFAHADVTSVAGDTVDVFVLKKFLRP